MMAMEKAETGTLEVKLMKMAMTPSDLGRFVTNLDEVYHKIMTKGTDYDTIPGTPKPTLLKPGAEMMLRAFNLEPVTEIIDKAASDDSETPFFDFTVKVTLYNTPRNGVRERIGDGLGSANTRESRYAFRWLFANDLPAGFDRQNVVVRKVKGYLQYRRNSSADEVYTLKNTVLKMAEKRALVDAVLKVTGADRIFTQDVEDMDLPPIEPEPPKAELPAQPKAERQIEYAKPAEKPAEKVEPKEAEIPTQRKTVLRFLKDTPELAGIDMNTYGPFKAGDVGNVPEPNAPSLVRDGYAQEIAEGKAQATAEAAEAVSRMDLTYQGKKYGWMEKREGEIEVAFEPPAPNAVVFDNFLIQKVLDPICAIAKDEDRFVEYQFDEDEREVRGLHILGDVAEVNCTDLVGRVAWTARAAKASEAVAK